MKKTLAVTLCLFLLFSTFTFSATATNEGEMLPVVLDFVLTSELEIETTDENSTRATGLITMYDLSLSKSGTTLYITGYTRCDPDVVKSGFKNLVVERRKTSSDSWSEYYDYGNVYVETFGAALDTSLVVASGYQYRISCKHYAKKSLFVTQTISNTSNIVTV